MRLLVRRAAQVERTLTSHGPEVADALTDVHVGDVLDEEAVAKAEAGCDAVVHAAAVFSFDPRDADTVLTTNERATEVVLSAAPGRRMRPRGPHLQHGRAPPPRRERP